MRLVITKNINKHELQVYKDIFDVKIIKEAARKTAKGLGVSIKSSKKIKKTKLKKLYITSSSGPGRVIFLLKLKSKDVVLVMLRPKNDKKIGSNMTIDNLNFKKILDRNLDMIIQDLLDDNFYCYQL